MEKGKELMAPHIADAPVLDYLISPSGKKAVAICASKDEAYAHVLDVNTSQIVKHHIDVYFQMLQKRHVLHWSYDEKFLVYGTSVSDEWEKSLIYRLDVVTGERTRISTINDSHALLRDVSTASYHIVVGDKVLDFYGEVVLNIPGSSIDAWISHDQFIVNGGVYDIATGKTTVRLSGKVFHYDPHSNTVFMLD